jgi:hypothetical protein
MPSTHIPTSTRGRGKRMTTKEREDAQAIFLEAFTLNGNIMLSCKKANVDRGTVRQWEEHDTQFSVLYHEAEKNFADFALAEFRKRAMEGYEKPVISMGRMVYEEIPLLNKDGTPQLDSKGKPIVKHGKPLMERVVSDTLLAMLIKRHFPEYRERQQVDLTANVSSHVTQSGSLMLNMREMSDAELALAKQLALSMRNREKEGKEQG